MISVFNLHAAVGILEMPIEDTMSKNVMALRVCQCQAFSCQLVHFSVQLFRVCPLQPLFIMNGGEGHG